MNDATVRRLLALEEEYTLAADAAVDEDLDDLVDQSAAEYPNGTLNVMRDDAA